MSTNKLSYDGKTYRWSGSLLELKSFVEQQLFHKQHLNGLTIPSDYVCMRLQ